MVNLRLGCIISFMRIEPTEKVTHVEFRDLREASPHFTAIYNGLGWLARRRFMQEVERAQYYIDHPEEADIDVFPGMDDRIRLTLKPRQLEKVATESETAANKTFSVVEQQIHAGFADYLRNPNLLAKDQRH
jgi:hypothetical protein